MAFTSAGLAVFCLLLAVAALSSAALIGRQSRFYHSLIDSEIAASRFHAIDGFRGYLAVGVMLHHLAINHHFYRTGAWELTPSHLSTLLGRGSVAFFFMITAFLFSGRAIDNDGRIDTLKFYLGRMRRLVPMYLTSVALLVITALALTHFRLNVAPADLARQILAWMFFTFPGYPDINGYRQTALINTVFWSLVYEWKFYILLPFVAALSTNRRWWFIAPIACVCILLLSTSQLEWFFLAGAAAAALVRLPFIRRYAATGAGSAIVVFFVCATSFYQPLIYTPVGAALLTVPFIIIGAGNSLFGLLTCRAARMLGVLSYSVYLLHNWVLYLASRLVNHFVPVAAISLWAYGCLALAVVATTVLAAAVTYRFVEYPVIHSGLRLPMRRRRERADRPSANLP